MMRIFLLTLSVLAFTGCSTISYLWYTTEEQRDRLAQRLSHPKDEHEFAAAWKEYEALPETCEQCNSKGLTSNWLINLMLRPCAGTACTVGPLADLRRVGPATTPVLLLILKEASSDHILSHSYFYADIYDLLGDFGTRARSATPALIQGVALRQATNPLTGETPKEITDLASRAGRALVKIGAPATEELQFALSRNRDNEVLFNAYANILKTIGTPDALAAINEVRKQARDAAESARKKVEEQAQEEVATFSAIRKLAHDGDVASQNDLGAMYIQGKGVKQDYAEAFKWLARAYAKGSPEAERNLYALLRREIMAEMVAEDVKWGKRPLDFMMPLPAVFGKLYYRERPLWVFVDAGWAFSSAYAKREYVGKLLGIVRRYPLKIDSITIRHWSRDNKVRELTYTEAPWTRAIFGDSLQTMTAEAIAPNLPPGIAPESPQEAEMPSSTAQ